MTGVQTCALPISTISLAPVVDGPVAETEAAARDSVREVIDFVAAYFKREPADP